MLLGNWIHLILLLLHFSSHLSNWKYDMKSRVHWSFIVESSFNNHSRDSRLILFRNHAVSFDKSVKHTTRCLDVSRRTDKRSVISDNSLVLSSHVFIFRSYSTKSSIRSIKELSISVLSLNFLNYCSSWSISLWVI